MIPKSVKDFYAGSIHLLYAVVAAQGFVTATTISLPLIKIATLNFTSNIVNKTSTVSHSIINNNAMMFNDIVSAFALIFTYFFLASAWYGYYKSTRELSYTKQKIGLLRWGIAMFNVFILYFMISFAHADNDGTNFQAIFTLLVLFMAFVTIAHLVKIVEFKKTVSQKNLNSYFLQRPTYISVTATGLFLIQLVVYDYVIPNSPQLSLGQVPIWNVVFIIISFLISGWFRWKMLDTYTKP